MRTRCAFEELEEGEGMGTMRETSERLDSQEAHPVNRIEEEELKKEAMNRLKEMLRALDRWKRDSLASSTQY